MVREEPKFFISQISLVNSVLDNEDEDEMRDDDDDCEEEDILRMYPFPEQKFVDGVDASGGGGQVLMLMEKYCHLGLHPGSHYLPRSRRHQEIVANQGIMLTKMMQLAASVARWRGKTMTWRKSISLNPLIHLQMIQAGGD